MQQLHTGALDESHFEEPSLEIVGRGAVALGAGNGQRDDLSAKADGAAPQRHRLELKVRMRLQGTTINEGRYGSGYAIKNNSQIFARRMMVDWVWAAFALDQIRVG
jgi:hypothetical protein